MDRTDARWRKSSHSGGEGTNADCVEVAFVGAAVAVRDSKERGAGALIFSATAWRAFRAVNRCA
ncbi:DUF397 domain-containing protein [Amycolatopsis cihanbeyliensis]|uniref:Uncharacterized protein DUF397 n=1 Tax=Amycolatopsis cihanbeyliensis TaxID=1128664 RepID=A0A542DGJ9_AMYCI|nr:DUF397 domain-containing protein [Amycolatopsis cihanbeyliensis]TQJ02180.1 uncharacterized protein DUF397 [Amycolatopsis cihanbeyliensis]